MKPIRTSLLLLACLVSSFIATAQVNSNLLGANRIEAGNLISAGSYTNYENTPFVPAEWRKGTVRSSTGKLYEVERMRYNAYEDRPEYELKEQVYVFAFGVTEFSIGEKVGTSKNYRNGFRPVEQQTERSFYELVYEGKTKLLLSRRARLLDVTQYNSATKQKRFDFVEAYYIARPDGALVRVKRDKKSLLDVLSDKAPLLEAFIAENKLKFRDWDDARKLLAHYDTL